MTYREKWVVFWEGVSKLFQAIVIFYAVVALGKSLMVVTLGIVGCGMMPGGKKSRTSLIKIQ